MQGGRNASFVGIRPGVVNLEFDPAKFIHYIWRYGNGCPQQAMLLTFFWEDAVSVHELESAVANLPPAELEAFAKWFENYLADAWDRRIEEDVRAGRLEEAGRKADTDFEAGRAKPL